MRLPFIFCSFIFLNLCSNKIISQTPLKTKVSTKYSGEQTIGIAFDPTIRKCSYLLSDLYRHIHTYNAFGLDNQETSQGTTMYYTSAPFYCSEDPVWDDNDFDMDGSFYLKNHKDALDAHFSAAVTYDFFVDQYDWIGLNGDGSGPIHLYLNMNYCNFGTCSTFVDQAAAFDGTVQTALPVVEKSNTTFDIISHELGHIYIGKLNPIFFNSSNTLSEALADIVAAMVNIYFNNQPNLCYNLDLKKDPWVFIEEIAHGFQRNAITGFYTYNSPEYLSAAQHNRSTTIYHWFYQIVDGDCSIGFEKAAALVFDAISNITILEPVEEQVIQFYNKTLSFEGLTSEDRDKVLIAWEKAGIYCTAKNLHLNDEDISSYQATVSWDASISDKYLVYLNGEFYGETTDHEIILSQLEENGCYDVEVRSVCSGIESVYFETLSFNTGDNKQTWTDSFEPGLKPKFSNTILNDELDWDLDQTSYPLDDVKAYHCNEFAFLHSFMSHDKKAILVYDKVNMESYTEAILQFHYLTSNPFQGKIILKIKEKGSIVPWKTIWQTNASSDTNSEWEKITLDLNEYVGKKIMLRFTGLTGSSGWNYMGLDQIKLIYNEDDIIFSNRNLIPTKVPSVILDPNQQSIQLNGKSHQPYRLFLTNIAGQIIFQAQINENGMTRIPKLPTGIYFVSFIENNAIVHSSKIVLNQ